MRSRDLIESRFKRFLTRAFGWAFIFKEKVMFSTSDLIWDAILNGVANGHIDDPVKMARDLLEVRRLLDGEVTSPQQTASSAQPEASEDRERPTSQPS